MSQIASWRPPAASPLVLEHTEDGSISRSTALTQPDLRDGEALGPSPSLSPHASLFSVAHLSLTTMTLCPQSGLEDGDLYDGAWCAEQQDTEPWLQVDAKNPVRFSGIVTQGRNSVWR